MAKNNQTSSKFAVTLQGLILGLAIATIYTLFFTDPVYVSQADLSVQADTVSLVRQLDTAAIEQTALERMGASGQGNRDYDFQAGENLISIETYSNDNVFSADFANTIADVTRGEIQSQWGLPAEISNFAAVSSRGEHPDFIRNLLIGSGIGAVLGFIISLIAGRSSRPAQLETVETSESPVEVEGEVDEPLARGGRKLRRLDHPLDLEPRRKKADSPERAENSDDGGSLTEDLVTDAEELEEVTDDSPSSTDRVKKKRSNRVN